MELNVILIPIYKSVPDSNEINSFRQCLSVFGKHPICIFTYKGLDISFYDNQFKKASIPYLIEYFDERNFENIVGYNRLMLSKVFYERFDKYKYMLIYQLDAWVFRDELNYWCQKDFDYIGAPWFEGWDKATYNSKIIGVGNGGFSLRNVLKTLQLIKFRRQLILFASIYIPIYLRIGFLHKFSLAVSLYKYLDLVYPQKKFEDHFISQKASLLTDYKIATPEMAIAFAFEMNPEKLFEVNGRKLPFGCHAWNKYSPDFWAQYISTTNQNNENI